MERISTVREIISLWPSRLDFAAEVGVPVDRVHKWIANCSVPAKHHQAIVDCARLRGLPVTAEVLVAIHDDRRGRAA